MNSRYCILTLFITIQNNWENQHVTCLGSWKKSGLVTNKVTASRQCRRYSDQQSATQAHACHSTPAHGSLPCGKELWHTGHVHWQYQRRVRDLHMWRESFANIILTPYWVRVSKVSFEQQLQTLFCLQPYHIQNSVHISVPQNILENHCSTQTTLTHVHAGHFNQLSNTCYLHWLIQHVKFQLIRWLLCSKCIDLCTWHSTKMNYNLALSGTAHCEGILLQKVRVHATWSKKKITIKGNSLIKYSI